MDDGYLIARRYLAPRVQTFWWWASSGAGATATGGEVITWTNGNTIAFFEEFTHVVERLAPGGLPPMEGILLLLAACRENWDDSSREFAAQCTEWASLERRALPDWLAGVFQGLDRVNALAADQRHSLPAKGSLAEAVFDEAPHRGLVSDASVIVDALECQPPPELIEQRRDERLTLDVLLEAFRSLKPGLDRLSPEALQLRTRTGLEQIVKATDAELWPSDQMRMLLGELMQDDELSGLARLARSLMAAIHLPRPLAAPEDVPAGGISDISNRGNLDRLLISELAHDDLTLAVRVATHEALYLRRETPPKQPPRRRAVLIDTGIRMWGVPRVYATAVAMALTAKADRGAEVDVYRSSNDGLRQSDLTTRDGLVEHLEALASAPHPGVAVRRFLEQVDAEGMAVDAVIITCAEVLADREYRASVMGCAVPSYFEATVARSGRFTLAARTKVGSKPVCDAELDLDGVLAPPRRPNSRLELIDRQIDPELPLIFGTRPFPLLLPHQVDLECAWHVENYGTFAITHDRRLMHWATPGQGAREIASNMPHGQLLWCQPKSFAERTYAVIGKQGSPVVHQVEVDLATWESRADKIEVSEPVRAVCSRQGMLFVIGKRMLEVFVLPTRVHCESQPIPTSTHWIHDRYFRGQGGWYSLSHDGGNARFELVVSSQKIRAHSLVTMFDVAGVQGAVGLLTSGDLWFSADETVKRVRHGFKLGVRSLLVSRNGRRLVAWGTPVTHTAGDGSRKLIDVLDGTACSACGELRHTVETELRGFVSPRTLRVHFRGIYADGNALVLVSKNGTHLRFRNTFTSRHALDFVPTQSKSIECVPFGDASHPRGASYSLRVARWSDGSRAFLDSRGLLHLKSTNPKVPDATLVLYEGPTACWTSDGRICGPDYFTGGKANTNVETVFNEVLCRFASLLP